MPSVNYGYFKNFLKGKKLSINRLAEAIGLSAKTLQRMARGELSAKTSERILDFFDTHSYEEVFGMEPSRSMVYVLKGSYVFLDFDNEWRDTMRVLGIFDSREAAVAFVNALYPGKAKHKLAISHPDYRDWWAISKDDRSPGFDTVWISPTPVYGMDFVKNLRWEEG